MAGDGGRTWTSGAELVGLLLVFAGVAASGWWLAAAGHRAGWQAAVTGVGALALLAVGLTLATVSARRRGGLMHWQPDRGDVQTYRDEYRRGDRAF